MLALRAALNDGDLLHPALALTPPPRLLRICRCWRLDLGAHFTGESGVSRPENLDMAVMRQSIQQRSRHLGAPNT